MRDDRVTELDKLHRDLGLKRLNPLWAKIEIVGGLAASGIGLVFMLANSPKNIDPTGGWLGLLLFVLGAYLAMAGHRSHLYQSNNLLAAWLFHSLKEANSDASRSASKEPS